MVRKKTCVFISGAGSNLKALIKNSNNYSFPININLVVSNNKNAQGLNIAKLHQIPYKVFNLSNRIHQELLLLDLKKRKISLICLAGYMKILSKFFINKFKGKIINIHPSLLPKYKGLNTFSRVLKSKDKYTGCTVHYVNEKLDSGKIILKKKVYVEKHDNENTLKNKVQQKEYQAFSEAVIKIYN